MTGGVRMKFQGLMEEECAQITRTAEHLYLSGAVDTDCNGSSSKQFELARLLLTAAMAQSVEQCSKFVDSEDLENLKNF